MAYTSIQQVEKYQRQHNATYWKVTDKSKRLSINQYDGIDLEESINILQDTLSNCVGDYVIVNLYNYKPEKLTKGSTTGRNLELMVQLDSKAPSNSNYHHNIAGPSYQDIIELNKKILELEHQRKIDELESQQKPSAMEKLADQLVQGNTINLLINAFMNKGTKQTESINKPDNTSETLKKFAEVDPNYEYTLAKMADYIKQNPSVLQQIKLIIGA
jgi:hypothetical protein